MAARNSRVGYVKVTGSRVNSDFVHRDRIQEHKKREAAAHLVSDVKVISEGVPRLGNTDEDHAAMVKRMRLRVIGAIAHHTGYESLSKEDEREVELLFEILGIDVESQTAAVLRHAGPEYTRGWNASVKTDN